MLKQFSKKYEKFYGIKYSAKYLDDKSVCDDLLNFLLFKDKSTKRLKAF